MKINIPLWSRLAELLLRMRKMFQTKVVEKIKTHISCSITFFNRAIYEIMWKNILEPDMPQMTIRPMRIAYWITEATNAQSEYVALTASSRRQLSARGEAVTWLRETARTLKVRLDRRADLHETWACGKITCPAACSGSNGGMLIEHTIRPIYTLVTLNCRTVTRQ
jgi:hypothetical protein